MFRTKRIPGKSRGFSITLVGSWRVVHVTDDDAVFYLVGDDHNEWTTEITVDAADTSDCEVSEEFTTGQIEYGNSTLYSVRYKWNHGDEGGVEHSSSRPIRDEK